MDGKIVLPTWTSNAHVLVRNEIDEKPRARHELSSQRYQHGRVTATKLFPIKGPTPSPRSDDNA